MQNTKSRGEDSAPGDLKILGAQVSKSTATTQPGTPGVTRVFHWHWKIRQMPDIWRKGITHDFNGFSTGFFDHRKGMIG